MNLRIILGAAILGTLIICLIACPKYKPVKQDYNAALVKYKDSVYMADIAKKNADIKSLKQITDDAIQQVFELSQEKAGLQNKLADAIAKQKKARIIKDTSYILTSCDEVVIYADSLLQVDIKKDLAIDSLISGIKTERALSKDIQAKQNEFIATLQADKSTLLIDNKKLQEAGRKKDRKVSFWKRGAIGNGIVAAALAGILFLSN